MPTHRHRYDKSSRQTRRSQCGTVDMALRGWEYMERHTEMHPPIGAARTVCPESLVLRGLEFNVMDLGRPLLDQFGPVACVPSAVGEIARRVQLWLGEDGKRNRALGTSRPGSDVAGVREVRSGGGR